MKRQKNTTQLKKKTNCLHTNFVLNPLDRLSSLPDTLLLDILSLLPTTAAAATATATSLLSRRYRNLWTQTTRLHLHYLRCTTLRRILRLHSSPKIHLLSLHATENQLSAVNSCFNHVSTRHVEEIKISIVDSRLDSLLLPSWVVSGCKSLVVLELDAFFHLGFDLTTASISLPNLKKLSLLLREGNRGLIWTLFNCCPLLEDLSLFIFGRFEGEGDVVVDIDCPHLKYLRIVVFGDIECKFKVYAPNLLDLWLSDASVSSYEFVEAPVALNHVYIESFESLNVPKLVGAISSVVYLHLLDGFDILSYLGGIDDNVMRPVFFNLSRLKTDVHNINSWRNLLLSLRCFPSLEVLELDVSFFFIERPLEFERYALHAHLLSKVKQIRIFKIEGNEHQIQLLKYILWHASALEELVVKVGVSKRHQPLKERKFSKALFELPRSSRVCEVKFFGKCIEYASSSEVKEGLKTCSRFDDKSN